MGEKAMEGKAITKVLSCLVVFVILMSVFSVAVIATDSSNSTASNVTLNLNDEANSSVESVALSNNITGLTCRDDLIQINKTETVVNESGNSDLPDASNTSSPDIISESDEVPDPDLPVINDTDIDTAKTASAMSSCSYVWIKITDKYCKGYKVYVDGVYQFTEGGAGGVLDGYCCFKVTPGYHTFKLTLDGKEVSKGWSCQCGVVYNWMSMNDMIPHWCEDDDNDNPTDEYEVKFQGTVTSTTPSEYDCGFKDVYICEVKIEKVVFGDYFEKGDIVNIVYSQWRENAHACGTYDKVSVGDTIEVYGEMIPIYCVGTWITICGKSSYYLKKIDSGSLSIDVWTADASKNTKTEFEPGGNIYIWVKTNRPVTIDLIVDIYYDSGGHVQKYLRDDKRLSAANEYYNVWTAGEPGKRVLTLKAWADYGNYAEDKWTFYVKGTTEQEIKFTGTAIEYFSLIGAWGWNVKVDKIISGPSELQGHTVSVALWSVNPDQYPPGYMDPNIEPRNKVEVYGLYVGEDAVTLSGSKDYYIKKISALPGIIFQETFDNLDNWQLVVYNSAGGSENDLTPKLDTSMGNPPPSLDVNGDSWCGDGAYSKMTFDYTNGLTIEFDMYVASGYDWNWGWGGLSDHMPNLNNKRPDGAYVDPLRCDPSFVAYVSFTDDGNYNRRPPSLHFAIRAEDGKGDGYTYSSDATDFENKWHRYKITILPSGCVEFYMNESLIWTSTKKIDKTLSPMPLVFGSRDAHGPVRIDNVEAFGHAPKPEITATIYPQGGSNYKIDIKFKNNGEESAQNPESGNGVHVQIAGADINSVDKGLFDEYLTDFTSYPSVYPTGYKVVEFYKNQIDTGEECTASLLITTSQENLASIKYRGWVTDSDDSVFNPNTNQYESYIARTPVEDLNNLNNPPYNQHVDNDDFTFLDYEGFYLTTYKTNTYNTNNDAIWIGLGWSYYQDEQNIMSLLDKLRTHSIHEIYLNIGGADQNGNYLHPELTKEQVKGNCTHFMNVVENYISDKQYDFQVLAWVNGNPDSYDIRKDNVRNNIAQFCSEFVSEDVGFDGIHFDYEEFSYGEDKDEYKDAYLQLLEKIKNGIPGDKILSIDIGFTWFDTWPDYVKSLAETGDEIVLMAYNFGTQYENCRESVKDYTTKMFEQSSGTNAEVIIGVPTYDDVTEWHKKGEDLAYALVGSMQGANSASQSKVRISIYANWETSEYDWNAFETIWHPS